MIGFAGMTHLGLVSAVAAAEKGFRVVAFDPDEERIEGLRRGELPVVEPGLPDALARNGDRLAFAHAAGELRACDLVYVAPDVPTDGEGRADLLPVRALFAAVDSALPEGAVLVVLSQVPPGFTRGMRRDGRSLYCQVETLVLGRALPRALRPERFIVGCADPDEPLPAPYRAFLDAFGSPVLRMGYESAELAKIAVNAYLAAEVTVTNELAELASRLKADWAEIAPALRLDPRIGGDAYLSPGLGLAGGNLERDLAAILRLAAEHGTEAGCVRAFVEASRHARDWALRVLHETVIAEVQDPVIALWGLAYKAGTESTKNAPSLALLAALRPFRVRAFDPVVKADPAWHPRLQGCDSALSACAGADALVVLTPWPEFGALPPVDVAARLRGRTVIDPTGALDALACRAAGLRYRAIGRPPG